MDIKINKKLNESFKTAVRSIGNIILNKSLANKVFNDVVKYFLNLKISDEELKELFVDYSQIFESRRYFSEMSYLFESDEYKTIDEKNTLSSKAVIDMLENEYGMKPWQLMPIKQNGVTIVKAELNLTDLVVITVIVPKLQQNLDIIEREMNKAGYYLAKVGLQIKNGLPYNIVMFNPYHQDSIKDYIKKNFFFIYHCNVSYHDEDVQENGFVPRKSTDRGMIMYPERIFFMYDFSKNNESEYKEMMKILYSNSKNPKNDGTYILYTLDVEKIPDDIEFYADPNYPNSCYVTDVVPYSAVVNKKIIKL